MTRNAATWRWSHRARPLLAAIVVSGMVSACGPTAPLEVAMREYPSSVDYGSAVTPAPSTAPPTSVPAPEPAPAPVPAQPQLQLPQASSAPAVVVVITAPAVCPAAGPLDPAVQPATPESTSAPQAATYDWRVSGSLTAAGSAPKPFPAKATEQVTNVTSAVASSSGSYTFDVVDSAAGLDGTQTVTTSYEIVPEPAGGEVSGVATTQASGIYITKVTTTNAVAGAAPTTFVPTPPILYLPFPADLNPAPSWQVNSADGATVEQYSAQIKGHGRVDACGKVLDAWHVQITGGSITSPTENLQLSGDYFVGTEYGGIPLEDALTYKGTATTGGPTITSTSTRTSDVVPEAPQ
jgi:hypothetical protein